MLERIKAFWERIKEFWKKLTVRQKTLIISLLAVVVVALVILGVASSQEELVTLTTAESTKQSSEIKTILDDNAIEYELSTDGLTYSIHEEDMANAQILLGSASIPTEGYGINDVFDGSFSTTESDKAKKYQLYLEEKMADQLETQENVKSATVTLSIPTDDGTLIADEQDTYASVFLELDGEMSEEQAQGLANWISTAVGNDKSDSVLIMDSAGNVLYSGGDTTTAVGTASTQLSYRQKLENMKKSEVSSVVLGTDVYDNVNVGLNLNISFDQTDYTNHHYYVDEGQSQGYLDSRSEYNAETTNGDGGIPGTDSNDDTGYMIQDNEYTNSTISDVSEKYLPSEEITQTQGGVGEINYDSSSVSVVATTYHIYDEDTLKEDGTLDDITFDQFVAQNSERVKLEVDPELVTSVSKATGFTEENITIMAYEVPFFKYSDSGRTLTDYLEIILAVAIFALLGLVVFRTTRKRKEEEPEPEISVETLLETTKEIEDEAIADIDYAEKSEVRLAIEKFVDENPEAVATLLRNWLDEEWGD